MFPNGLIAQVKSGVKESNAEVRLCRKGVKEGGQVLHYDILLQEGGQVLHYDILLDKRIDYRKIVP